MQRVTELLERRASAKTNESRTQDDRGMTTGRCVM